MAFVAAGNAAELGLCSSVIRAHAAAFRAGLAGVLRRHGIPTWKQAGFSGGAYENLPECNMLFAKTGTPPAVLQQLEQLLLRSYAASERVKSLRETLADEEPLLTGAALRSYIDRTWPVYRQLSRAAGIAASGSFDPDAAILDPPHCRGAQRNAGLGFFFTRAHHPQREQVRHKAPDATHLALYRPGRAAGVSRAFR